MAAVIENPVINSPFVEQAVNVHGGFARWAFLEAADHWDAGNLIRSTFLAQEPARA